MAKCYVAGPMTGYPELNYPKFHSASERLRKMGFEVVSPAELNPVTTPYREAMINDIKAQHWNITSLPCWALNGSS